ncbi:hypothetical protein IWQ56_005307, partial [Coemansia nantahalensis]
RCRGARDGVPHAAPPRPDVHGRRRHQPGVHPRRLRAHGLCRPRGQLLHQPRDQRADGPGGRPRRSRRPRRGDALAGRPPPGCRQRVGGRAWRV